MSVELNQANGLPVDAGELQAYVRSAVHKGRTLDTKSCARITGVRPSTLERWKAQAQFEQRAKRRGIRDVDVASLSESVHAVMNGIRLSPVLIEATSLAVASRMPSSAVRAMVTRINSAISEDDALAVIAAERSARADDIGRSQPVSQPGAGSAIVQRRILRHLLRLDIDDLLEVTPESREQTVARLRDLCEHANRALDAATRRWNLDQNGSSDTESIEELCVHGGGRG